MNSGIAVIRVWILGLCVAVVVLGAGPAVAQGEEPRAWVPPAPDGLPSKWDWVQLTSEEWLKGEFVSLYDEEVEFESDELDTLTLDWEDIKRVRTARRMEMRFEHRLEVKGRLFVDGDVVRVMPVGGPEREFSRADLVTVTIGSPKEIEHWSMKITLGANTRTGNADVVEANLSSRFVRRSAKSRLIFEYIGNYNVTEDVLVSDNHRATAGWDSFISGRLFWTPVSGELFRDPFQNIARRTTLSVGVGYQLIDTKKTEWDLSGGPGAQRTRFDSVVPGQPINEDTPVITFSSSTDMELAKWLDFLTEFRIQLTNEATGQYNHHMEIAFESDITKLLDFDIQWVWDRIQKPRANSDGTVPQQDDFRLIIGVGFDF